MIETDVLIIGAGAAGLMCALEAGKRGRQVILIDHSNKAGKKILMSGGGRCNFTNKTVTADCFISNNPHFSQSALKRYTPEHFIALVKKHRVPFHEKTLGQLFCDHSSKDILNLLLSECHAAKVTLKLNCTLFKIIQKAPQSFKAYTNQQCVHCQSLIIATGGLSIPTLGASPLGYKIAQQFKLPVTPVRAALVAFTLHEQDKIKFSSLTGISLPCQVSCNQQQFTESLLFTHRGLSGPAMLQISSYWQPGDALHITLLPDIQLYVELLAMKKTQPNVLLINALTRFFPKKLVSVWLSTTQLYTTLHALSNSVLQSVSQTFQAWIIKPNQTEGYRTAEVTLGGVDCKAISSKTFQVHQIPGLFFIGEVLDVTGWLGGYNFQWAWSSGYAAGQVV